MDEATLELSALAWFGTIRFQVLAASEVNFVAYRQAPSKLLLERCLAAIPRLNPLLPHDACEQVIRVLSRPPYPTLIENNRWFHSLLTGGVPVEYRDPATGEMRGAHARLVDFEESRNNELLVVRQLTVAGPQGRHFRPDLTVFLNGMPVALLELKDPTDPSATLDVAIDQLHRYQEIAPALFIPNLLLAVSDGLLTRVGSLTSDASRFSPWRPEEGGEPSLEALIRGLFAPERLVDYLATCVAFEEDERGGIAKKIGGYHQFRAVRKARSSVLEHLKAPLGMGDGRGGVVWHTQGSGKSLTMLMLAGALVRTMGIPRLWSSRTATTWTTNCSAPLPWAARFCGRHPNGRRTAAT